MSRDQKIGIFLLIVSILLCYETTRLGIGKTNNPGPGFFPFLAGLIIGGLSLSMILTSFREKANRIPKRTPLMTGRAALFIAILLLFGLFVEKAGFFVCTFFVTLIMLRANGIKKWPFLFFVAFSICAAIFLFFNLFLEVRLPLGILSSLGR